MFDSITLIALSIFAKAASTHIEMYFYSKEWLIEWVKGNRDGIDKDNTVLTLVKTRLSNGGYEINQFLFDSTTNKLIKKIIIRTDAIDNELESIFNEENIYSGRVSSIVDKNTLYPNKQRQLVENHQNLQIISNQIIINGNVSGSNIIAGNENNINNPPK